MKVLITGANGFLGKEIVESLSNHKIITLSRSNSDINCDLSTSCPNLTGVDFVIHCAGKAHMVPLNVAERNAFFDVNVQGTRNLLLSLSKMEKPPQSFVFISTVAVYGLEAGSLITEEAPLNAKDPYGLSKIEAEKIISHWCQTNNVVCTILRLPLLAGPNPPGNLNAMIQGIKKGYYFDIGKGTAKKSIVLISDVANIIHKFFEIGGVYNLTDRHHPQFREISTLIARQLGKTKPKLMPLMIATFLAKLGDFLGKKAPINSVKMKKIISDLTFCDDKAVTELGWNPSSVIDNFHITNK
jgi:nucleoside-diphosphate-sugar epimerase